MKCETGGVAESETLAMVQANGIMFLLSAELTRCV